MKWVNVYCGLEFTNMCYIYINIQYNTKLWYSYIITQLTYKNLVPPFFLKKHSYSWKNINFTFLFWRIGEIKLAIFLEHIHTTKPYQFLWNIWPELKNTVSSTHIPYGQNERYEGVTKKSYIFFWILPIKLKVIFFEEENKCDPNHKQIKLNITKFRNFLIIGEILFLRLFVCPLSPPLASSPTIRVFSSFPLLVSFVLSCRFRRHWRNISFLIHFNSKRKWYKLSYKIHLTNCQIPPNSNWLLVYTDAISWNYHHLIGWLLLR